MKISSYNAQQIVTDKTFPTKRSRRNLRRYGLKLGLGFVSWLGRVEFRVRGHERSVVNIFVGRPNYFVVERTFCQRTFCHGTV